MTGMIEWGKNQNPPKIAGPKFNPPKNPVPSHKNFQKALNDITIMNLQIVLNTPKNPFLNQAAPKKFLPKFSYPNKRRSPKLQTKKDRLIIPVT